MAFDVVPDSGKWLSVNAHQALWVLPSALTKKLMNETLIQMIFPRDFLRTVLPGELDLSFGL